MAGGKVKPHGERVLVKPLEEQETKKGGIIIPDTAKEKPQEGKVVALGTGKVNEEGKKVDFTVKKGDKVLISKYGGTEIKIDGEQFLIMPRMSSSASLADRFDSTTQQLNYSTKKLWQLNNYNLMK